MKFVKCTEGLPPYNKPICGKLKGRPAIVTNSKLVEGFVSANGNLERIEDVEWLDESLPGKEDIQAKKRYDYLQDLLSDYDEYIKYLRNGINNGWPSSFYKDDIRWMERIDIAKDNLLNNF